MRALVIGARAIGVCCGLAAIAGHVASAASITIEPSKDNTLIQDPNLPGVTSDGITGQLSNGQGDIFVGRTAQDGTGSVPAVISIRRGLIEFDIADNVPAGATITGVSLTMNDVMGLNGAPTLGLHLLTSNWGEGASFFNGGVGAPAQNNDATWLYTFYNASNPSASPTWTTPGGDFSSTVSGSAVDSTSGPVTWASTPQMVADVQAWLNGTTPNDGWLIQGDESKGQTAKRLNSRESTTSPPMLTITYTVPEPSAILLCLPALAALCIWRKRSAASSR